MTQSEAGTSVELLGCPFCGASVEIRRSSIPRQVAFQIKCPGCAIEVTRYGSDLDESTTRKITVAVWNRRAPIQLTPAETEDGKAGDRGDDAMDAAEMIAWFRANGWMVAVHNDYRQHGRFNTFWLLTHPNGRWVKGEGASDALALYSAMGAARHD